VNLYLVHRGFARPKFMHKSLIWHPVIIATAWHTAKWETHQNLTAPHPGTIWAQSGHGAGWMLCSWHGMDVDHFAVRGYREKLPDGLHFGCEHDRNSIPWTLLAHAIWYSARKRPAYVAELGVTLPTDRFTLERIEEDAGMCTLPESQQRKIHARRERGGR
jgi:hypothetical protein